MKKESKAPRVTASTLIGIMVVLVLTLIIWGTNWYQISISLLAGIIIALTVYDPKIVGNAIAAGWFLAGEKLYNIKRPKLNWSKEKLVKFFRSVGIVAINYVPLFILIFAILMYTTKPQTLSSFPRIVVFIVCLFDLLFMAVTMLFSLGVGVVIGEYNVKYGKNFYKKRKLIIKHPGSQEPEKDHLDTDRFLLLGMLWYVNIWFLLVMIIKTVYSGILGSFCLLLLVFQLIFSAPLALGLLFNTISQNREPLIITLGVLLGGLSGIYANHLDFTVLYSFAIGLFIGLLFRTITWIFKDVEVNVSWFFQGKANWTKRFYNYSFK